MFSLFSNIPPSREIAVAKHFGRRLKISKNEAGSIASLVAEAGNGGVAEILGKFPPEQSIPALVYALSYATPKGFLERAREVVLLVKKYDASAIPAIMELIKGELIPVFSTDFSRYYNPEVIRDMISLSYYLSLRALSVVKHHISKSELSDIVDFVKSNSRVWRTGGWEDGEISKTLKELLS